LRARVKVGRGGAYWKRVQRGAATSELSPALAGRGRRNRPDSGEGGKKKRARNTVGADWHPCLLGIGEEARRIHGETLGKNVRQDFWGWDKCTMQTTGRGRGVPEAGGVKERQKRDLGDVLKKKRSRSAKLVEGGQERSKQFQECREKMPSTPKVKFLIKTQTGKRTIKEIREGRNLESKIRTGRGTYDSVLARGWGKKTLIFGQRG